MFFLTSSDVSLLTANFLEMDTKCCSHFDHVIKRCDLVGGLFEITCGSEAYQHYAREKVNID